MTIRVDALGTVASGEDQGASVVVETQAEGGFLVLLTGTVEADYWVEDRAALEGFFDECRWVVEWQEPEGTRRQPS